MKIKIKAVQDNDFHWFLIPNELEKDFYKDLENKNFVDSGKFGNKYSQYMTGGDLNLTQLYVESKD